MSIPTEPLYIGARYVQIKFYAAPRNPGDPSTIVGTLTLMPDENVLVLDALKGDKGDKGDAAPFWRPEWNSTITNPADLAGMSLGADDEGRAWYISGYWHVWTGTDWAVFLGAIPGPPGPTPIISITAEQIAAPVGGPYGTIEVDPGGTPEEPTYHLKIPGIEGPKGDNARITEALDYFGAVPAYGETLVWTEAAGGTGIDGFVAGAISPFVMRWITFPEASFGPAGTFTSARQVVLSGAVPAQINDYYAVVMGHLTWGRSGLFNSAQVSVEVRWLEEGSTSDPSTGELIAAALYDPSTLDAVTVSNIFPHHSDASNPSKSVSPDSNVGRIPANTAVRVYVILYRFGGSGNYQYAASGSYLSYEMFQVP